MYKKKDMCTHTHLKCQQVLYWTSSILNFVAEKESIRRFQFSLQRYCLCTICMLLCIFVSVYKINDVKYAMLQNCVLTETFT